MSLRVQHDFAATNPSLRAQAQRQREQSRITTLKGTVSSDVEAPKEVLKMAQSGNKEAEALILERFGSPLKPYSGEVLPYADDDATEKAHRIAFIFRQRFPMGHTSGTQAAEPEYQAERARWRKVVETMAANSSLPDFIALATKEEEERYRRYSCSGQTEGMAKPGEWGCGHSAYALMEAHLVRRAMEVAEKKVEDAATALRLAEAEKRNAEQAAAKAREEEARIEAEVQRRLKAAQEEAEIQRRLQAALTSQETLGLRVAQRANELAALF